MTVNPMIIQKRRCLQICVVLVCLFAPILFGKSVKADYNQIDQFLPQVVQYGPTISNPESGQYVNLTLGQSDKDAGGNGLPNGYGANLPISFLRLYAAPNDANGARTMLFDIVDRRADVSQSCSNYRIIYTIYVVDSLGVPTGAGYSNHQSITACFGSNTINIPAGLFTRSSRPEDNGIQKAILSLAIQREPNPNSSNNVTATIRLNSQFANLRMGYLGANYAPAPWNRGSVTIYPSLTQNNDHEIEMRFRGPCGVNQQKTITWGDDDYQSVAQFQSPDVRVDEYDNNGSYTGRNVVTAGPNYGLSGDGNITIDMKSGHQYILRFNWVNGGNGIRLDYPYDSADFYLPCRTWSVSSVVSSVVSAWVELGRSVDFNHTINSSSPTGHNPIFTTRQANLDYPPSNSTNRPGEFPLGSQTVADNDQKTKSIGTAASELGARYCQTYTVNPSGMSEGVSATTSITSTAACTEVVGGKTDAYANGSSGLIEGIGEAITFSAGVSTTSFHAAGGWTGYDVTCTYTVVSKASPSSAPVSTGTTGSCNQRVTAAGGGPQIISVPYTTPANAPIGTQYCMQVTISAANGSFINNPNATSACITVSAKPFVRAYLGDVMAGGRFGTDPSSIVGSGDIKGYLRGGTRGHAGSGVEFAAIAAGTINEGFASATLRDINDPAPVATDPLARDGLTFANGPTAADRGGYFSSDRQATDWFVTTKKPGTTCTSSGDRTISNLTPLGDGQTCYTMTAGSKLKIDRTNSYSNKHTIYVIGDVVITDDITYRLTVITGGGDITTIPYFALVVKGNIYIDSSVSRLDGLYIAQPKDAPGGVNNDSASGLIYTCTEDSTGRIFDQAEVYNNCQTKLAVNGSFIAQKVKLLRTNGTLRDIQYTPATTATNAVPGLYDVRFARDSATAQSISVGRSCVTLVEPSDPNWNDKSDPVGDSDGNDNVICYKSRTGVGLKWYHGGSSGLPAAAIQPLCTLFNNPDEPAGHWWSDNWLCPSDGLTDLGLEVRFNNQPCTLGKSSQNIVEQDWDYDEIPLDANNTWDGPWGMVGGDVNGSRRVKLCFSNGSDGTNGKPEKYEQLLFDTNAAIGRKVAAEEFRLTPEFLLGNGAFAPPPDKCTTNCKYNSIVTLPPIL